MIKAMIFDCFGVIRADPFDEAYARFGGDRHADQDFIVKTFHDAHSRKIESSAHLIAKHLGVAVEDWQHAVDEGSTIQYDVLEYVRELRQTYRTALLSNIQAGGLERIFDPGFLDQYFELSVGSGDIGVAKPDAGAYGYVADRLSLRMDECLFIDDRLEYVSGARSAGMRAVVFAGLDQLKDDVARLTAVY